MGGLDLGVSPGESYSAVTDSRVKECSPAAGSGAGTGHGPGHRAKGKAAVSGHHRTPPPEDATVQKFAMTDRVIRVSSKSNWLMLESRLTYWMPARPVMVRE